MRRELVVAVPILFSSLSFSSILRFTPHKGSIDFSLDAITIYSIPESSQRLKIYWEIPNKELLFTRADSGYVAYFEITVIAYDEKGDQVGGDSRRRSYTVPSYETTLLETERIRDSLDFPLPEGRYKTKVIIRDLHSTNLGVEAMDISVPKIHIEDVSLSELLFTKDGSPVLEPDFDSQDKVVVLYEIYNLPLLRGYNSKIAIKGGGIERILEDSRPVQPESLKREEGELDFSYLGKGDYQVSVSLISEDGTLIDEKSKSFYIEISPFLDGESFRKMVDQLQYIATTEEMERLREAKPEQRESEWNSFWKEKDPTPSTEINEFKREYYRRIDYANTHFKEMRKGWTTDRGKIYIIYGPPDEVESHPYELYSSPYEIWYYYGRGLKFIFVDEHGIGDYRLLSPKGERW